MLAVGSRARPALRREMYGLYQLGRCRGRCEDALACRGHAYLGQGQLRLPDTQFDRRLERVGVIDDQPQLVVAGGLYLLGQ